MLSAFQDSVILLCSTIAIAYLINLLFFKRWALSAQDSIYNYIFPPGKMDESSERNGGELVAEVIAKHGVKFVYTLCGGHISPILVGAEKLGIRVIDTRHEATAVFAADATARLSGKVGVAVVTAGPGVTNTVTAMKNAQMAESPIILIGGAAATLAKGRGALQDIEQVSLLKTVCKATYRVTAVRQIIPVMRKAFQDALSGTPGPVFVEIPIDTLYPYKIIKQEAAVKDPKNLMQWVASKYISHHLKYVFADAFTPKPTAPLTVEIPNATNADISKTVDLIKQAKRPILIIGSQATLSPVGIEKVSQAVAAIGIPCFLGGMARGLVGKNHPRQMRHTRKDALKDADLVILAGAICDFRLSYGRTLPTPKRGKVIVINRDKTKMIMNSPQLWHPTLAVLGDVGDYLSRVADQLTTGYRCEESWTATLREREELREAQLTEKAAKPTEKHLNPIKVLQTLDNELPSSAILVVDGGDFVGSAAYILRPRSPLSWLDPGPFGTLGCGAGFALGAKLCRPESEVWIIFGDGSCGYSVVEYDTFVRHKTPVISLVGNDAAWTQIAREQVPLLNSGCATKLGHSSYHVIPEAFGAKGILLESSKNITEVFKQAQSEYRDRNNSVLINALIGTTDFRDGSISV